MDTTSRTLPDPLKIDIITKYGLSVPVIAQQVTLYSAIAINAGYCFNFILHYFRTHRHLVNIISLKVLLNTLSVLLLLVGSVSLKARASVRSVGDSLTSELKNIHSDTSRAAILLQLSEVWLDSSVVRALTFAEEAMLIAEQNKWVHGRIRSNLAIANCYSSIREWNEALKHYFDGLKIAEQSNKQSDALNILIKISETYYASGRDNLSLPYKLRALDLAHKLGETFLEAQMLTYLGGYYLDIAQQEKSIIYYRKAYQLLDTSSIPARKAMTMNNLAAAYMRSGKEDSALWLLNNALQYIRRQPHTNTYTAILATISDYYAAIGSKDSALHYAKEAARISDMPDAGNEIREKALWLLYTRYDSNKNPREKLQAFERYITLRDENRQILQFSGQAKEMMRYEYELKTATGNAENKALRSRNDLQRNALWWACAGLLFLGGLAAVYYYSLLQNRKKARTIRTQADELLAQKITIQDALREKKMLLKEIHHRVKNNLQVISALLQLQGKRTPDAHVREALVESQNRVMSIAFLHHNLYQHDDINGVEMSTFLAELIRHLESIYRSPNLYVRVQQNVNIERLELDLAIPLALIINELLTNSYKYAFPGREKGDIVIWIKTIESTGNYYFEYTDNGIGFQFDEKNNIGKTLGLTLVHDLCRQLGGKPIFKSGAGFTLTLSFPPH